MPETTPGKVIAPPDVPSVPPMPLDVDTYCFPLRVPVEGDAARLIEKLREPNQNVGRKLRDLLSGIRIAKHRHDLIGVGKHAIGHVEPYRIWRRRTSEEFRNSGSQAAAIAGRACGQRARCCLRLRSGSARRRDGRDL